MQNIFELHVHEVVGVYGGIIMWPKFESVDDMNHLSAAQRGLI